MPQTRRNSWDGASVPDWAGRSHCRCEESELDPDGDPAAGDQLCPACDYEWQKRQEAQKAQKPCPNQRWRETIALLRGQLDEIEAEPNAANQMQLILNFFRTLMDESMVEFLAEQPRFCEILLYKIEEFRGDMRAEPLDRAMDLVEVRVATCRLTLAQLKEKVREEVLSESVFEEYEEIEREEVYPHERRVYWEFKLRTV